VRDDLFVVTGTNNLWPSRFAAVVLGAYFSEREAGACADEHDGVFRFVDVTRYVDGMDDR